MSGDTSPTRRILYRSDERLFRPGEPMPPPGDHFNTLSTRQKEIELLIRNGHANGTSIRALNLYAFPDKSRTEKYWALQSLKYARNFYSIEVEEIDILHVGDMGIYNYLVANKVSEEEAARYVSNYWEGTNGPAPDIEYIVCKAIVDEHLGDVSAQKEAFDRRYR